jgi:hypothetical protein
MVNIGEFNNIPPEWRHITNNKKKHCGGCSTFVPLLFPFLVCSSLERTNVEQMWNTVVLSLFLDRVYLHWNNGVATRIIVIMWLQCCVYVHGVSRLLHIRIIPVCERGCAVNILRYESIIEYQ